MKRLVLTVPAEQDLAEAAAYFEGEVPGLGGDFLDAALQAMDAITENPKLVPVFHQAYRRRLVKRYRYGIIYRETADELVIVAVTDLRRSPEHWQNRL